VALQKLVRIDVDRRDDVVGEWKFIESFTDFSAEPNDSLSAKKNVKPVLALEFLEGCGRWLADNEFVAQIFLQAATQCFG
jgi:hypothetical protein